MMVDAWQVFLDGLDPVRLERERFPAHEVVQRESFYLDEHRSEIEEHERANQARIAKRRAFEMSLDEDFEREIVRQQQVADLERAWKQRRVAQIIEFQRKAA